MARFFVEPDQLNDTFIVLTGEPAEHAKVLRLKVGETVHLCDGQGREAVCTISDVSDRQLCLVRGSVQESTSEPAVKVSIYMAFPKGDKFEHVVQKATELGAYEIVAFPSARCVSRPDDRSLRKKLERWQKIAASAAEQSGRGCIPRVRVISDYESALKDSLRNELSILFYENEKASTLKNALDKGKFRSISVLTGPEGGLEMKEVEQALCNGLQVCTLGNRILRCETAPLCALSAIMYWSGEF